MFSRTINPKKLLVDINTTVVALVTLPSNRLVSGSDNGILRLWNAVEDCATCAATFIGRNNAPIQSLLSLTSDRLIVAYFDGVIQVWDISSNKVPCLVTTLQNDVSNLTTLAVLSKDHIICGYGQGIMRIWKISSTGLQKVAKFIGHADASISSLLVVQEEYLVVGYDDGKIQTWCLLNDSSSLAPQLRGEDSRQHSVAVDTLLTIPDSLQFLSMSVDDVMCRWEVGTLLQENAIKFNLRNLQHQIVFKEEKSSNLVLCGSYFIMGLTDGTLQIKENGLTLITEQKNIFQRVKASLIFPASKKKTIDNEKVTRFPKSFPRAELEDGQGQGAELGAGTFGAVYTATMKDSSTNHGVAVAIKKNISANVALKEAELHIQLSHANVIYLYGITNGPECSLVMERMLCSLFDLLQNKDIFLGDYQRLSLMQNLAAGLEYMHNLGLVHRDLKSDNALVSVDGYSAKLCDLGFVAKIDKSKPLGVPGLVGTQRWWSPAITQAFVDGMRAYWTFADDIFGLAMVLWEIESRASLPYKDLYDKIKEQTVTCFDAEIKLQNYIIGGEREIIPERTSTEVRTIIEKGWSQDASSRPNATTVHEELNQLKQIAQQRQEQEKVQEEAIMKRLPPTMKNRMFTRYQSQRNQGARANIVALKNQDSERNEQMPNPLHGLS